MATQTQHFNLTKPDWEDRASISVLNANTDIIDAQMYDNEQSAANAIGNMAAEYDDTATYEVGDFCIYSEVLYKCVTAVSVAEAFDSTKWTQTTAAENFGSGGGGGSATLAGLTDVNLTSPTDGQALVYDATNQEWVNGAGGGGNANERVLTKAEYEALTDAEKLNGTTYYINDAVPEGKEIQPVIYSLEEREVGVWTDGKPLYQKTISFGALPNNTTKTVAHGIQNADFINPIGAFAFYPNAQYNTTISSVSLYNVANGIVINVTDTNVEVTARSDISAYTNCYVTLQYTKTTDTAGSGVWTTSGVPAVHYSTDEHIIGTWIDGATLYEKTFVFNNLTAAVSDWTNLNAGLSNISQMVSTKAYYNWGNTHWSDTSAYFRVMYDNQNLYYYTQDISIGVINAYVTIQYTKTTN